MYFAIIINIIALFLGIYLSLHGRSKRMQIIIWVVTILLAIGNTYLFVKKEKEEKPFYDILTPCINSLEAYELIKSGNKDDIQDYYLVDIIGSYYICLKKPDIIFHRIPEWCFIFRHKLNNSLLEFKITDTRIPEPVWIEVERITDGQLEYYVVSKESYDSQGILVGPNSELNFLVNIIDEYARTLVTISGRGPEDKIVEVTNGVNSIVLSRVQLTNRLTDTVSKYFIIDNPIQRGKTLIAMTKYKGNEFYDKLNPITSWRISAEKAIQIAIKNGAKGMIVGKEQVGGPGVIRLFNGERYNLNGTYWNVPYRIKIRPILIEASTGEFYAMDNNGNYSKKWEKDFKGFK
jgi:hypothetical protein